MPAQARLGDALGMCRSRRLAFPSGVGEIGRRTMNRFLQFFLNYGLVVAILVWAATVALMAYHLHESPWRWAFILMSLAGLGTVWVIFLIRKYVNKTAQTQQRAGKAQ